MGPSWEDATPITFPELLSREVGGFAVPPGYDTLLPESQQVAFTDRLLSLV